MKIGLLGYARTNKSVHDYLKLKHPGAVFTTLDEREDPDYLKHLTEFDVIYRTPIISPLLPELQQAIKAGVEVSTATNLFFQDAPGTIVGITGTKGKGTTTTLIYEVFKAAHKDVYLAGNNDCPEPDIISKLKEGSITVLELSSFRLQDLKYSPHIAGIVDIFPEHLDRHKNFREYTEAKSNICKFQGKDDFVFYLKDSKYAKRIAKGGKGRKIAVDPNQFKMELKIIGEHNRRNASMAAAICMHMGIDPSIVLNTISSFGGLPHRLQHVKNIAGVDIYNDSAASNPQATIAAIDALAGRKKILILGGREKDLDYSPLIKKIRSDQNIRLVVLFDEDKEVLQKRLSSQPTPIHVASSMENAVSVAIKKAQKGDVVLFSPAATSYASFNNYSERGDAFVKLIKKV